MSRFRSPHICFLAAGAFAVLIVPQRARAGWYGEACDRLAASPADPNRRGGVVGVLVRDIDIEPAYAACEGALRLEPPTARNIYQMGRVYLRMGRTQEASDLFAEAGGEYGYPAALLSLGDVYYTGGPGVPASKFHALGWYEAAAKDGIDRGSLASARMLDAGEGIERPSPERAAAHWRTLAAKGHPEAQERLRATPVDRQRMALIETKAVPPAAKLQAVPESKAVTAAPPPAAKASEGGGFSTTLKVIGGGIAAGLCYFSETCWGFAGEVAKEIAKKGAVDAIRGKSD